MRLAQTQVWPALRYFEVIAPLSAISISASSKTMNGARVAAFQRDMSQEAPPKRDLLCQFWSSF
jgi:hypothetical protein